MEKISKHISYNEACFSNTALALGITNHPTDEQLERMKLLAENVFEPLREHFATPIRVNSFFRSSALNKAIGGSKTSQHMANNGAAIDITCKRVTNKELGDWIKDNVQFDQLIFEQWDNDKNDYRWIHVSYKEGANRKQVLEMYKQGGRSKYRPYKD